MPLSISIGSDSEVFVYMDASGRDDLIAMLQSLEVPTCPTSNDHFHLFSKDWGTGELSEIEASVLEDLDHQKCHHIKMMMRPNEEFSS